MCSHLMYVMCYDDHMSLVHISSVPSTYSTEVKMLRDAWLSSKPSPRTREAYSEDLAILSLFLERTEGVELLTATNVNLDRWARSMEADEYSPATRARRLSSVASFYAYACRARVLMYNPATWVKRPKQPDYSPRLGLNLDTAPKVIAAVEEMGLYHQALVGLCLCAGLRVSEALSVEASDIREESGHRVLEVSSKGGARDIVPLSPMAMRLISEALSTHRVGKILPNIDRFAARRMVASIGKEAKLSAPLTVHDLRHGAATCSLEAGEPLHRVQQLLRHADPRTTQRYDHSRDRLDSSAAYGLSVALGGNR